MNTSTNNIEQLRKNWRRLSIEAPAFGGAPEKPHGLPTSEKQRVMRRLGMLAFAGIFFLIYLLLIVDHILFPIWLIISYETFMTISVILNIYMLVKLRRADFATMTTINAISFITYFVKFRNRCKIFLITLAIPLVAMIIWVYYDAGDHNCVIGGIVGGVIGSFIGYMIDRKFRNDLKMMKVILGNEES